jgi:tetratricopeptide (TPR) repeat protein
MLRRAIALNSKNFPAHYDLGKLLVRLKRYEEAVVILERAATMSATDPGIHYQLFTAYTRLKRKPDAERELAIFKRLEEARKGSEGDNAVITPDGQPPADTLPPPSINSVPKTP